MSARKKKVVRREPKKPASTALPGIPRAIVEEIATRILRYANAARDDLQDAALSAGAEMPEGAASNVLFALGAIRDVALNATDLLGHAKREATP